ncbi:MAG: MCE family protein [Deltaproteobacteria bacterium]|nr:MCE family protein [Deltaproteobacteria bacterium]
MESQAKYFLVGIIVSMLIVAAIFFVLWVSDVDGDKGTRFYTVYFKEQGLSGLQVDSQVTMKGIKVGTVSEFKIRPNDVERVKVTLKLASNTPVKTDTRAVIKRNLLTGLAIIELAHTSNSTPELTEIPDGENYPVISEGQTPLDQLTSSVPNVINDASEVMQRLKYIFSDSNLENITSIIKNMESFSSFLGENRETFSQAANNLKETLENSKKLILAWEKTGRSVDNNVNTATKELVEALNQITETSKTLDEQSKSLTTSLNQNTVKLVSEVSNLARDLSIAAQSLAITLEEFEEPRKVITGPAKGALGPGESRGGN